MSIISDQIKKTKEMEQYEEETGKKAIWRNTITETFKKWQKGEKNYNLNRDRISLYVPEGLKNEWMQFSKKNNYSTLSKLIRDALKFFMDYKSKVSSNMKDGDIDFLSTLSHNLKDPLTSLKAYLQLITEQYSDSIEENILSIIHQAFKQSLTLEKIISENLDSLETKNSIEDTTNKVKCDVLLIEDDKEIVKFLDTYFSSKGYSITSVLNGTSAFEKLKEILPRVVLLDIILPDISGYEIIKSLKSNHAYKNIPIFFLTAIPKVDVLKKVKEFGAAGLISKPFNLDDFNVIYEYLNGT